MLSSAKLMSRASLLFPLTLLALVSHMPTATECLQLNCALLPLIVTRPMIGTIPFFPLASVHEEQDFECCSHTPCFLCAKLVSHALNTCKQTTAERRKSTLMR